MTLYIIGLGLHDEKDVTVRGLEAIKKSSKIYLEHYTSILQCSISDLEKFYEKSVELADRDFVEKTPEIMLELAKNSDVSFLVVGDGLSATTHTDLMMRANSIGVNVQVIYNTSIMTAVGVIGLELYKYGKTVSIVFPEPNWNVTAHYDGIRANQSLGLHTLCLLDIKVKEPTKESLKSGGKLKFQEPRFMTVAQGIQSLLNVEKEKGENVFTPDTLCVGCARMGSPDQKIIAGKASELLVADFGKPPHSLVVPGKLHFVEEEALALWNE